MFSTKWPRITFQRSTRSAAWLVFLAAVSLGVSIAPAAEVVAIPPNDPHLKYVGRFDTRDPAGPRCEWPACGGC